MALTFFTAVAGWIVAGFLGYQLYLICAGTAVRVVAREAVVVVAAVCGTAILPLRCGARAAALEPRFRLAPHPPCLAVWVGRQAAKLLLHPLTRPPWPRTSSAISPE